MTRPTYKELDKKISQAKEAISKDGIYILEPHVIAMDALELGYEIGNIKAVLLELLAGMTPQQYVGSYPPQKSYEEDILNCDLFAFKRDSKRFGCEVYVKYALKKEELWLVSFHQHRDKG
ncbi:MAG: hypothetical protein JXB42_01950 [Deltaproteobacteria bacterium]|nr:hypothetical protein [Deltaproteobacteria bacterium]